MQPYSNTKRLRQDIAYWVLVCEQLKRDQFSAKSSENNQSSRSYALDKAKRAGLVDANFIRNLIGHKPDTGPPPGLSYQDLDLDEYTMR